jgi:hypothetical protein
MNVRETWNENRFVEKKYKMIGIAACYSSSRYTAATDRNAEVSTLSGTSITGTR